MGNNSNRKNKRKTQNKPSNLRKNVDLDKTDILDVVFVEDAFDTSFIDDKEKKKVKTSDIEVLDIDDNYMYDDKKSFFNIKSLILFLFSFALGFIICIFINHKFFTEIKIVKEVETKVVNDDNYVFLGDSIFEMYNLEKHYEGLPVINSGVSGNTTMNVLDNMQRRVYRYNPSKVFVLIGTNDLYNNRFTIDEIVNNIEEIIKEISKNRPYAEIYISSILPVNNTDNKKIDHAVVYNRTNEEISNLNSKIELLCEAYKIDYIDLYSLLIDDDGNLDIDYTVEGLHISEAGYEVITNEIMKYINVK